jgi:peptidoglycan/xylan/chitin deacetylase (PgdA/CDA1 family)
MARHHRARLTLAVALVSALLGLATAPAQADVVQTPRKGVKINCAKVKCIALTFDDGPGKYAGKLLDTFKKHKSKATFFLEGQYVKSRKAFAKRMAKEGHELGNHSYTHPHLRDIGDDQIRSELERTEEIIFSVTGKRSTMMRPPYGEFDERVQRISADMGLPIVLWNGGSRDWATKNADAIYKEVMRSAKRDGVILMHDWVAQTVQVMPKILTSLKKQGYHMVTVSNLLRDGQKLEPGEIYPDPEVKQENLESPDF